MKRNTADVESAVIFCAMYKNLRIGRRIIKA